MLEDVWGKQKKKVRQNDSHEYLEKFSDIIQLLGHCLAPPPTSTYLH